MRWPQPYLIKRGNRFSFRRRPTWPNTVTHPITISLGTTDPALARFLAQRLAGKWNEMMETVWIDTALSATQRTALMRKAADQEIGMATRDWFMRTPKYEDIAKHRFHALAYECSRTIPLCKADPEGTLDIELMQVPKGCAPGICKEFPDDYNAGKYQWTLTADEVAMAAELLTGGDMSILPEDARQAIWRGKVEARMRLAYAIEAGAIDQPGYVERLIDDPEVSAKAWKAAFGDRRPFGLSSAGSLRNEGPKPEKGDGLAASDLRAPPDPVASTTDGSSLRPEISDDTASPNKAKTSASETKKHCPYLEHDTRRFSEQIERIVATKKARRQWISDEDQARRVLWAFAWITGNKPTFRYEPSDISVFVEAIRRLPTSFRWAEYLKVDGGMIAGGRLFADVVSELPKPSEDEKRSNRTIDRDLTILSAASRILHADAWKPASGKDLVMDFNEHKQGQGVGYDDGSAIDRMPFMKLHVETLTHLPLYIGNAGAAQRLKPGRLFFQDAATWVPLLIAYSGMSREEACGIEMDDVYLDEDVPFIAVRRNMTKSVDSINPAGLKNPSRQRLVPIHPELERLGLADFVKARRKEGIHDALFFELYVDEHGTRFAKRGGTRFYARAGRHILEAVDRITPLPRTESGDRADLHSLRTYVYSMLSTAGQPEWIVSDIVGHARSGVGQKKYNRSEQAVGRDRYLALLRDALVAGLPNVTAHLAPRRPQLLRLAKRSATGSPPKVK